MSIEIDGYTSVRYALRYWECPDDETLATFIDGALASPEYIRVNDHLNYCPRCYKLVSEARAVLQMAKRDKQVAQDEVREEYRELFCEARTDFIPE